MQQLTRTARTAERDLLTPSKLVGMIRMLPDEYQYRVLWNNPEFGGNILYLPKDGDIKNGQELLICDNPENREKAIRFKCDHMIATAKNLSECFWHINKPYRIQILQITAGIYDFNGEYEKILRDAWTSTEYPHQAKVESLIALFDKADPAKLMDDEEKAVLARLPDTFTVYRGYSETQVKAGYTKRRGLAWTVEKKMAAWFATRWNHKDPRLAEATACKSDVYMYTNCRGEREMVLNPRKLKNVTVRDVGRFE